MNFISISFARCVQIDAFRGMSEPPVHSLHRRRATRRRFSYRLEPALIVAQGWAESRLEPWVDPTFTLEDQDRLAMPLGVLVDLHARVDRADFLDRHPYSPPSRVVIPAIRRDREFDGRD